MELCEKLKKIIFMETACLHCYTSAKRIFGMYNGPKRKMWKAKENLKTIGSSPFFLSPQCKLWWLSILINVNPYRQCSWEQSLNQHKNILNGWQPTRYWAKHSHGRVDGFLANSALDEISTLTVLARKAIIFILNSAVWFLNSVMKCFIFTSQH